MASEQGDTQLDALKPEHWRPELLAARYADAPFLDRCLNATQDVAKDGDTVHFYVTPSFTVSDVNTGTGAVSYSQDTITAVDLTMGEWRHVAVKDVWKAKRQAKNRGAGYAEAYKKGIRDALVQDWATKLLAESANVTTTDITSAAGSQPGEDELTAAIAALAGRNVPTTTGELTFVVTPDAYWSMKKQPFLRDADKMGINPGGMLSMQIAAPYGVPVFMSTQVTTDTERENLLYHKEAFAYGIQEDIAFKEIAVADAIIDAYAFHYLGGWATIRENHAAIIRGAS